MTILKGYNSSTSAWEPVAVGADVTSTLTTKGDLLGRTSAAAARVAVGTDGQVLTAASTTSTGLAWSTPSSGGMTLLSTTTLSGANTVISGISTSYTNLQIVFTGISLSTTALLNIDINSNTSYASYNYFDSRSSSLYNTNNSSINHNQYSWQSGNTDNGGTLMIYDYASSVNKAFNMQAYFINSGGQSVAWTATGAINYTDPLSNIRFRTSSGTFSAGTVKVYGVK